MCCNNAPRTIVVKPVNRVSKAVPQSVAVRRTTNKSRANKHLIDRHRS